MSILEAASYFIWEIIVGFTFGILFSSIVLIIMLGKIGKLGKLLFAEYKPLIFICLFMLCFGFNFSIPALLDIIKRDIVIKDVYVSENSHELHKRYYLKIDGRNFYYMRRDLKSLLL